MPLAFTSIMLSRNRRATSSSTGTANTGSLPLSIQKLPSSVSHACSAPPPAASFSNAARSVRFWSETGKYSPTRSVSPAGPSGTETSRSVSSCARYVSIGMKPTCTEPRASASAVASSLAPKVTLTLPTVTPSSASAPMSSGGSSFFNCISASVSRSPATNSTFSSASVMPSSGGGVGSSGLLGVGSCFPQPLSTASSARVRKKENIRFMVSASSQNKLE